MRHNCVITFRQIACNSMGIVAALLPQTTRLQRLRSAIRGRHAVESCVDWGAVTLLCESQPIHMAVVDLYAGGDSALESLRGLRRRFPRLTIVAYVTPPSDRLRDLFDMGRLGIDALVLADRDDSLSSMVPILEVAEARGVAGPMRAMLAHTHPIARDAALLSVTRAHERLTSETLASTLFVTRRALARHLEAAGLPTPQRLLTWGRLIVAAHLMEDGERSFDRVARTLHYPSGSAFRNMCQRYVHATPSEIRAKGGAAWVIDCMMRDELRDALRDDLRDDLRDASDDDSRDHLREERVDDAPDEATTADNALPDAPNDRLLMMDAGDTSPAKHVA